MKATNILSKRRSVRAGVCLLAGAAALVAIGAMTRTSQKGLVAHEWGTFTSVQGGDGVLLDWRPLQTSRLPGFVYDWSKPGLNRRQAGPQVFSKARMITLQRMETPVIYFYSDRERTVDVSVEFPKGLITEWYPQAAQIGPATAPVPSAVAMLDNYAHKAGAKSAFTFASLLNRPAFKESRAHWANIEVKPARDNNALAGLLPSDKSGSHYFSARETDADYVQAQSLVATNPTAETEKFIFYRGAGSFTTPLLVTAAADGAITVANTGSDELKDLFVLSVQNRAGNFIRLEQLAPGEHRSVKLEPATQSEPLDALSGRLGREMADALTSKGLYRREAEAMVKTWNDSWFQEDGVRVLYILPREWTDKTLPLTIEPAPHEVVRVMVGRAEVITPAIERQLSDSLTRAGQGDSAAREEALAQFRKMGRFAEPALVLVAKNLPSQANQTAWDLLQASAKPL
jgi:hypothetical protein